MPPALLNSQIAELEAPAPDEPHLAVDVALSPEAQDALVHAFLEKQSLNAQEQP